MRLLKELLLKVFYAGTAGKKWNILVVSVTLTVVLGAAAVIFIVDPHYRYREPSFYDMVYYEIYATAPRLLKSPDYDLFMLGTSMTRNFFLEDIDRTFNRRSIKFAASGGTMRDLRKFFDTAVKYRGDKLKEVVFSLDIYPLNKPGTHWEDFDYMYRDDHKEDYRYLFSRKSFSSIFYLIKRKNRPKRQRPYQSVRNRMFSTEYPGKPYGLDQVMRDAVANEKSHHTQTPYDPAVHRKNLYEELLPIFDDNPQIKFTVYLPPYHIYTYCQSEHFKEAEALIHQREDVMKELLKRKNVTLHDFQSDREYVMNHTYFSDVQHFSVDAARRVLADLVSGRRRLTTAAEVEENTRQLQSLIRENMPLYYQHVKEFKRK